MGAGARVLTIGLGRANDVNGALLLACATRAEDYQNAPDAEGLGAIYRQIAYAVSCPVGRLWGKR
jgi:hypothetical protein